MYALPPGGLPGTGTGCLILNHNLYLEKKVKAFFYALD